MLSTFSVLPSPKVRNQLIVDHHLLMASHPGVRNYCGGVYSGNFPLQSAEFDSLSRIMPCYRSINWWRTVTLPSAWITKPCASILFADLGITLTSHFMQS